MSTLTRVLALIGTVFAWLPIAAMILTGTIASIVRRQFQVDYLMPAELFPSVLIGGTLLLWAASRVPSRRLFVAVALCVAIVLWFGAQVLAQVTGLADGDTEPIGWPLALVMGSLALYTLSVVAVGIAGALLLRDLFHPAN